MLAGLKLRPRCWAPIFWDLAPWPILAYYTWQAFEELEYGLGCGLSVSSCWNLLAAIPPAAAVWLQIRMAPHIAGLARRRRREELAVTPMPAGEYLWSRLRRPLLRLLAPAWLTWLAIALRLFADSTPRTDWLAENSAALAVILCLGALATAISLRGALRLLARLCRAEKGLATDLWPITWSALALAIPYGGAYLVVFGIEYLTDLADMGRGVYGLICLGLGAILCVLCPLAGKANPWRAACAAYYTFD